MDKNLIDWRITLIVCSIIVATLMGTRQCFGLFLDPVSLFNNSGKEIFSIAISLQALTWGVSAFLLGMIIDKFGPQKALAFGIICSAIGIYILSNPENNFLIFSFGAVTGIGLGAGGMSTIVAIIGKTAPAEKKSMAMGLVRSCWLIWNVYIYFTNFIFNKNIWMAKLSYYIINIHSYFIIITTFIKREKGSN